jgi:hypothetical protein
MGWPPRVGELLPQGEQVLGVREKLTAYSLKLDHQTGGPKAHGFAMILGITLETIDYLDSEIRLAAQRRPIQAVVDNEPYGWKCVIDFPLEGIGSYSGRVAKVRTVWELASPVFPPRLVTAFLKT